MSNPRPASKIGRKRRAIGWALLILGLLVTGVWGLSRWWLVAWTTTETQANLYGGAATFVRWHGTQTLGVRGWKFEDAPGDPEWRWTLGSPPNVGGTPSNAVHLGIIRWETMQLVSGPSAQRVLVLLWPIPLLLWIPAALLLRSGILARRRANTAACAKCGYSLAGLAADAPCPECGQG